MEMKAFNIAYNNCQNFCNNFLDSFQLEAFPTAFSSFGIPRVSVSAIIDSDGNLVRWKNHAKQNGIAQLIKTACEVYESWYFDDFPLYLIKLCIHVLHASDGVQKLVLTSWR